MQQAPTSCAPSTCLVPGLAESSGESWTTPLKVLEVCAAVTAAVHTSTPNRARQLVIACSPRCLTWPWMASAAWRTRRAVVFDAVVLDPAQTLQVTDFQAILRKSFKCYTKDS